MNYQVEKILAEQHRAYSIFNVTKRKFENAIAKARKYLEENGVEINRLEGEKLNLFETNKRLESSIATMEGSVNEINRIMGVQ